ncbi:MAG: S-adenosyl-l-methionine hydroxide adenosyltransferase family protein [Acidobacteriota bacterium]
MPGRPLITLTTDFGYKDPFVGVMKGVILKINPEARIVDLTHGIRPQDVQEAAFAVGMNYRYFPSDTIHVVVVDPGVGSARRPLLVFSENHFFIGPDNGVFSYIYRVRHETLEVVHITAEHYFLRKGSPTFQGRDLFAPVAAWFSRGVHIEKFGDPITDYRAIDIPFPEAADGRVRGSVIHIDRFGNAVSNISIADLSGSLGSRTQSDFKVFLKGSEVPLRNYYYEAKDDKLYSLLNSSEYLEFFVCGGSASSQYNVSVGDRVEVVPADKPA